MNSSDQEKLCPPEQGGYYYEFVVSLLTEIRAGQ